MPTAADDDTQDVVARAPEIRKDVEEAIREGSVDGLLTDGVKAVVRVMEGRFGAMRGSPWLIPTHRPKHIPTQPTQRRQLQEDIIPQLASEPEQAAKLLLEELPKIAQRTVDAIPRNPKDVRSYVCVCLRGLRGGVDWECI